MNNLKRPWAVTALAGLAICASARAQIVVNGGFETGDFSGWTEFGDTEFNGVDNFFPHSGTYAAFFGPINPAGGGIHQTLAANAGARLIVSFWLATDFGQIPSRCVVTLDGQVVATITDYSSTVYQQFTATITVANANPELVFTFVNEVDYFELDDVTVTLDPGPPPCYANCDGSTGTPVLTANDFTCFINAYAAADMYANCDGSTGTPLLTGNDFVCFIGAFAAGCS